MYTLSFDPKAIEFFEKLDRKMDERIWSRLQSTKDDPHHFFERLVGREEYKLRVGDYRIIAAINDNTKLIQIRMIGHRKNIYNNL